MTFFGILRDSPLAMFFVLISLLNVYYGWRVLGNVREGWKALNQEPLRPQQKRLIDQAAFFLGIPLGVFVHELGHALMVWFFGGRIADVGYGFYWGYVSHSGFYTQSELWIISMAGTIGSLLYGLVMWLIFRRIHLSTYRYFALRILRVHIIYSLVFYPLFTLFTFVGDWRTIYDFGATPMLSGATLVIHLAVLGLFWYADRRGIFDMPGFESKEEQARFEALKQKAESSPYDAQLQLSLVEAYRRGGATHLAENQLQDYLKDNPNSADGFIQQALLQTQNKSQIPKKARDNANRALKLGLTDPASVALANRLVGEYEQGVGRYSDAEGYFTQGLEAAKTAGRVPLTAHFYYLRAVARRRQQKNDQAYQDIQEALKLAQGIGRGELVSHYETELSAIQDQAKRSAGSPPPR